MAPRTFLDAAGHAPVHPVAREAFLAALDEGWADPRRLHAEGRRARLLLDGAREALGASLGCRTEELRLTASHTSSLHLAVQAVARARRRTGSRVVASAVERSAVHQAARHLDPDGLAEVPVDEAGTVDLPAWDAAVGAPGTAVAALQHANGEVGTVQPVEAAHEAAQRHGVPLLVDVGSSAGHVTLPAAWDVLAADPADWGALPGVGVLAVRAQVRTDVPGPHDEAPWAPGGVSVPAALAAAASLRAVDHGRDEDARRRALALDRVRAVLEDVPDVQVLGPREHRLPHVLAFSCLYVDGEALLTELDRAGVAVGSGSACTTELDRPSHVLTAMGALTHGNVRLTLARGAGADDVEPLCRALPDAVARVRAVLGADGL